MYRGVVTFLVALAAFDYSYLDGKYLQAGNGIVLLVRQYSLKRSGAKASSANGAAVLFSWEKAKIINDNLKRVGHACV